MSQLKSHPASLPWYVRLSDSLYVSLLVLTSGIWLIYSNTFRVPFLFDDESSIVKNTSLRHLGSIWRILHPTENAGVGGRPLLNLSYAINYALGGTQVVGYHIVDLVIHTIAAVLLLVLLRLIFKQILVDPKFEYYRNSLSLIITALWAWHPLQTISVTYLSQRAESLMGLFYLLTILLFFLGSYKSSRLIQSRYYMLSIITCFLGIITKEVMITAPFTILLFDRVFVSGSFTGALKKHANLYLGYALSLLPLIFLTTGAHYRGVGFDQHITPAAYALTESEVVIKYIFLILWPHPLIFDYGWYTPTSISEAWPYCLTLCCILSLTIYSIIRLPKISFLAAWFFILLSPTSSFIPVASQPMAENRLYLPLAALVTFLVLNSFYYYGKRCLIFFSAIAVILALLTYSRNSSYSSALSLWSETVTLNPLNARAHANLGLALSAIKGHEKEAISEYNQAVSLKPDSAEAHNALGEALLHNPSKLREAINELEIATELKPNFAEAHYNLGTALLNSSDKPTAAVDEFKIATNLNPEFTEAYYNLGNALTRLGKKNEAIIAFKKAIISNPDFAQAHANLGNIYYTSSSESSDAISELRIALKIDPDFTEAHYDLANILSKLKGYETEAIKHFELALNLNPEFALAHNNLANLLIRIPGKQIEAISHYRSAIHLMPNFAIAHYNLGLALLKNTESEIEGREEINTARRLNPELPALQL